jgi:hypothetical protein
MSRAVPAQASDPDRFRRLARAALSLAGEIRSAHADLRGSHHDFIGRAFRLGDAAGQAEGIANALEDTASDLDRYLSRPSGACEIPWGVCPEHGNTLVSTGRGATCQVCSRTWDYGRVAMPCEEPARWHLSDAHGESRRVCDGHATDARARLDHARLTPLRTSNGGT